MNLPKCLNILKNEFTSWEELEGIIRSIVNTKEKGDVFEVFTKFLLIINKDQYQLQEVYLRDEIPADIKEKLHLEPTDHGVDGVAVRVDGKIVAFQSKFRSNRTNIPTYAELSTFWAESEYADYRLIVSNTDDLPKPSQNRRSQLAILADDLDSLDYNFFIKLRALVNGEGSDSKTILKPRDYQEEIIKSVIEQFSNADRGKVLAACGTGKTLISKWIHDRMNSQHTLFLAPSLSLIKQTIEEWCANTENPFAFIAVCSDQTVVEDIEEQDELKVSQVSFPVTTDAEVIQEFLSTDFGKPKVVFSTYHSADAIMNALIDSNILDFKFDLALYDEAHRTAGTKDSKMFTYALEDRYIPVNKRLFLTATERVVTQRVKSLVEQAGSYVYSMDDVNMYGQKFAELNFGNAIEKGIIADYKVVACAVREEEFGELISRNTSLALDIDDVTESTTVDNLLKQVIVGKAIKDLGIRKLITYHGKVQLAKTFITGSSRQAQIPLHSVISYINPDIKESDLFLGHVNGMMTARERKHILNDFKNSNYGVLSNAKCLTEGIDVPAIDAVYFADPKSSTVDIIQAIGRALRKKVDQKKTAYILIPIVIPYGVDTFSGIHSQAFDTLHNVIQALRDQDSGLADIIDEVNYEVSRGGGRTLNPRLSEKLSIIISDKVQIKDFEECLQLRIGEVNCKGSNDEKKVVYKGIKGERASKMKRLFTSIGDYGMESYKTSLVLPTVEKFGYLGEEKLGSEIKVNNNNVSHAFRLGAIDKVGKKNYILTEIGNEIKINPDKFSKIFKEQMLKYSIYNDEEGNFIFPYRTWLKVLKEVKCIRKIDFLYCLYPLRDTSELTIDCVVENIKMLQETYKKPEVLSDENRQKVLEILNQKFDVDYGFQDVWTTKTACYNQWRYFMNHLSEFTDAVEISKDKGSVLLASGGAVNISDMLSNTKNIEDYTTFEEMRSNYKKI